MILVIDNYDSFTYNLVQYLGELGADVRVRRNDQVTLGEVEAMAPEQILISPGPGRPENAGITTDVDPAIRTEDADPGRVPRPPGDRARLRRHRLPRERRRCTARRPRSCTTARACSKASPNRSRPGAITRS